MISGLCMCRCFQGCLCVLVISGLCSGDFMVVRVC